MTIYKIIQYKRGTTVYSITLESLVVDCGCISNKPNSLHMYIFE